MDAKICSYLRSARIDARLTQQAAADQAGISRQQLNRIENGGSIPEWETVDSLVSVYKCSKADAVRIFTGGASTKPGASLAAELTEILEPLDASAQQALCAHLRDVARSWVSSVSEKLRYYKVLRHSFCAGFFQQFSRFRAILHSPTIAV